MPKIRAERKRNKPLLSRRTRPDLQKWSRPEREGSEANAHSHISPFGFIPAGLLIWGKYESSFDSGEPERLRKDVPKAEIHVVDGGHFALDTAADPIAALVQGFVGSSREGFAARRAG